MEKFMPEADSEAVLTVLHKKLEPTSFIVESIASITEDKVTCRQELIRQFCPPIPILLSKQGCY